MKLGVTAIGALLGLSIQMYSNALRKLCHPWDLVLGMGLGAVVANHLAKADDQDLQHRIEMLTKLKAAANERRFIDNYDVGFGAGGTDALDCPTGLRNYDDDD